MDGGLPDARFVPIHRDPYTVFQSTLHMVRRTTDSVSQLAHPWLSMKFQEPWLCQNFRTLFFFGGGMKVGSTNGFRSNVLPSPITRGSPVSRSSVIMRFVSFRSTFA